MIIPLDHTSHAIEVLAVLLRVIKRERSTPDNTDTKESRILPAYCLYGSLSPAVCQ